MLWQIIENKAREKYGLNKTFKLRMADTGFGIESSLIARVDVRLSNGSKEVKGFIAFERGTLKP